VITPTDLHRIPGVHTDEGGHYFHDGMAFPMDVKHEEAGAEPSERLSVVVVVLIAAGAIGIVIGLAAALGMLMPQPF
jgi:hypothetical protein